MQIRMGIVGVENVTVTATATNQEVKAYEAKESKRPIERDAFDDARVRFATQGAEQTRYFLA